MVPTKENANHTAVGLRPDRHSQNTLPLLKQASNPHPSSPQQHPMEEATTLFLPFLETKAHINCKS